MLAGIEAYRRRMAAAVRAAKRDYGRRGRMDVDVALFDTYSATETELVDREEHRRLACQARSELWSNIRLSPGEIINAEEGDESEPTEAVQVFEEMSHTE